MKLYSDSACCSLVDAQLNTKSTQANQANDHLDLDPILYTLEHRQQTTNHIPLVSFAERESTSLS